MIRQAKKNASKLFALLLSGMMLLSMVPFGVISYVFAAEKEAVVVKLPDGVSATVTMTDENDAAKNYSAETNGSYEAVFEKLDDETTYTLQVSKMKLYKSYSMQNISFAETSRIEISAADLSEKEAQSISFSEKSIKKTYGDSDFDVILSTAGSGSGQKTYSSSKEDVATVNENGRVSIKGVGSTEIKVSIAADENYKAAEDTLVLTVERAADAISYIATEVTWAWNISKKYTNPLTVKEGAEEEGTITYRSSDPFIARVDDKGKVTVLSWKGTATITASFKAKDGGKYEDSEASYTIRATKQSNALSYTSTEITTTYGAKGINDTLLPKDITGTITYSSSKDDIVQVDDYGNYTIVGVGEATITAKLENDEKYADTTAFYTIIANKKTIEFEINKEIAFGQDDPDLTADIKNAVEGELVNDDSKKDEVVNRVVGCILYKYPPIPDKENRPVKTYFIDFQDTKDDDFYTFKLSGKLTVKYDFDPTAQKAYSVSGLNDDGWGKEVVIEVTDADKYAISTSNKYKEDEWTKSPLEFKSNETEKNDHTFYIKDLDTHKISDAITINFGVDTESPNVVGFDFKPKNCDKFNEVLHYLTFGIFFKKEVEVEVTASDGQSGVDSVVLYYTETPTLEDDIFTAIGKVPVRKDNNAKDDKASFILSDEQFKKIKTVSAIAIDKVGNESNKTFVTSENSKSKQNGNAWLQIESTPPVLDITGKDATYLNQEEKQQWYNDDVEFEISAGDSGEENSGIRSVCASINGINIALDEFKDDKENPVTPYSSKTDSIISDKTGYYFINEKTENLKIKINTKQAEDKDGKPYTKDGLYTVAINTIDNAGNVSEQSTTIYKDTTEPVITGFSFNAKDYVEGDGSTPGVEVTDYGFYFKEQTEVAISASDAGSGVQSITYYTVDIDGGKSDEITLPVKDNQITFVVKANFKGQIYAIATDNVENSTAQFVTPNSAIVEDVAKHEQENHIEFSKEQTVCKTSNGEDLYSKDIPVEITVTDTYSGIRSINWSVVAPYDTGKNQNGEVTVGNGKGMTGDTGWTQEKTENNLVYVMKKTVTVSNNSNDIVMKVKMTDRAGNASENEIRFSIDKTAPSIEVTYDNNDPDDTYTDIFNADRTAMIKVIERNFNKNDIVCKITNTDGVIPTIGSWTEHKDTSNPDATYHTAEIVYHADGDYTFDIAYADLAANKAADVAQHKFTIDQTNPVVSVSYDNMSALNGNYYKADRIATITIVEHNFDASRVNVIGTASDNGAAVSFPVTSAWSDNGNTHTATIHYAADAKYRFDIEFNDKAGNSIVDYTPEEFYVDKTAPKLEIGGVADKSANNDVVAPTITFTDTNFNANAVKFVLMGVRNGEVVYSSSSEAITNGQRVTFADFERTRQVDDIYVLTATTTDMAGNETTGSISFSANRFGSVYELASIGNLIGKYLQSEEDIVFTETNVDSLKKGETKIKLTKNGTPKDLVEGTDYTITVTGGNGQWSQYKYTINKTLFADDGRYSISVYSVDAAGNINENIDETKEAEISFGIDKTSPVIVPVDFESGVQYPVEVKKVSVEVKDNLVLEGVKIYLNGAEIKYANEGETYTFDIPEKNEKQNVKIVAVDAAGNEHTLSVENFLVSTNLFVRWFNNTPLFIGSIVGVILLCTVIIFLVIYKRRKSGRK